MSTKPEMNTRAWSHFLLILLAACLAAPAWAEDSCSSYRQTSDTPGSFYARYCVDDTISSSTPSAPSHDLKGASATGHAVNIWGNVGTHYTHPVSSMASLTFVDTETNFITGLDFTPDAQTLYALNRGTGQFGTYGIDDATFTSIGSVTPPPGEVWVSLVVDPVSGTIYAISLDESDETSTLLTVDPADATLATVGTIDADILGAAMNCEGEMYAISIFSDNLYQIDPATGAATLVGSLGVDLLFAQDIDFDNETGTLYHWAYVASSNARYGTLDTTTGAFSELTSLGAEEEFVGAIRNVCDPTIFTDGFESGDTTAWSSVVN